MFGHLLVPTNWCWRQIIDNIERLMTKASAFKNNYSQTIVPGVITNIDSNPQSAK